MTVAHGALIPGGPGLVLMVVAAVLFAFAVYLFVTKGPPRTLLLMMLAAIAITIGAVAAPKSAPDVHVSIEAPRNGATVPAREEIEIRVSLSGDGLSSGHLHVLVDDEVVSMTDELITSIELRPGPHTIEAELVSASHAPLSPRVVARAEVTAQTP